jgi:hypothetical protein
MVTAVKKILVLLALVAISLTTYAQGGTIKIRFVNTVKEVPVILDSAEYTNPFNETYRIKKLKYYISNIVFTAAKAKYTFAEKDSYHLLDEADTASLHFNIPAKPNTYSAISFTIGVDSIKNVSGAQSGALDPAKGMFWTWNSGYIFFKLEGSSPASGIINNKVEYHIGGYAGNQNAIKRITLQLQENNLLQLNAAKIAELVIEADIDQLWHGPNDIKIALTPVTMSPGALAMKIADNYSKIFAIKKVSDN